MQNLFRANGLFFGNKRVDAEFQTADHDLFWTYGRWQLSKMSSSPKVLIVDLSENYGGSSSRVLSLMARAKHGSMALAGLRSGAITREATRVGLPVHILASHKADPRLLPRLIRLIRSEGYAILDSQNIQSKFWSNIAALITKTGLVSTLNSR